MNSRFHLTILSIFCFCAIQFAIGQPQVSLSTVASGFSRPVVITHAGDDRIFVAEQDGVIKIIDNGTVLNTPFLDINGIVGSSGNEQGLLGLAFHPNYASNGHFFLNYTNNSGNTVIARYTVSGNPNVANANSAMTLMTVSQPFSNHNGGQLAFSPVDGFLYIGLGDGGSANDPGNRSQNPQDRLGKILRIDVDSGSPFGIPASNPFVGNGSTLDEIWAIGLRNPWRFSFDQLTGDMYIGDVGQNAWEEIDFQPASSTGGENYGWRCYEGNANFNTSGCAAASNYDFPIHDYQNTGSVGCAVTGGYVYRGSSFSNMVGKYFYTDFCSGTCWMLERDGNGNWQNSTVGQFAANNFGTMGQGNDGEVYAGGLSDGRIYRLVDVTPDPCATTTATVLISGDSLLCANETGQLSASISGNAPALACGANSTACTSSQTATLGTGTSSMPTGSQTMSTPNPSPYLGYYTGARVQYLFRASELQAAGINGGTLSSLAFDVAVKSSSAPNFGGFTIKMGCTSQDELSGFIGGTETVYGPASVTTAMGWNTYNFSSTFDWDGISNLLIEVCFDNGTNNWSLNDRVRYNDPGFNCSFYDYEDDFGDECSLPGGSQSSSQSTSNRPNIQLGWCAAPTAQVDYSWTPTTGLSSPTAATTDVSISSNTTYTVRATYINGCFDEDQITVEVDDPNNCVSACAEPTGLTAGNITSSRALLQWTCDQNTLAYELRGNRVGAANFITLPVSGGCPAQQQVNGLQSARSYFWQVRQQCADQSWSEWSAIDTFTTLCEKPSNLNTTNITSNSARLNWSTVTGATGYTLRGRQVGGSGWTTVPINSGGTSSLGTGNILVSGTSYEWQIRANCSAGGNSGYSTLSTFTTTGAAKAGFEAKNDELTMELYPNPNSGVFQIEIQALADEITLEITNLMGKQILLETVQSDNSMIVHPIALQSVSAGSYFMILRAKDQQIVQRFIVN